MTRLTPEDAKQPLVDVALLHCASPQLITVFYGRWQKKCKCRVSAPQRLGVRTDFSSFRS